MSRKAVRGLAVTRSFDRGWPTTCAIKAPRQGMHRGEIERLKPEYRLALSRNGKALVQCEPCSSWKCERVNRLAMA